jgi:oligopeptide/dipeptide ABC transporter ATP-binding protein
MALLEVRDLEVSFPTDRGTVRAVRGVSFDVESGETVAIIGESGSGKSATCLSLMRLLPKSALVTGAIRLGGTEVLDLRPRDLRQLRGQGASIIFQDPLTCLNPYKRIGWQISEAIQAHGRLPRSQVRSRALELLRRVHIPRPADRLGDYPHQLSGGMRQRVMIAMSLALHPQLLIADEPTTALDVSVQADILDLLAELKAQFNMAILFVTHDLGVVAGFADRVLVMYAGRVIEVAGKYEIYDSARHPYTWGLLGCTPSGGAEIARRLVPIDGRPPDLTQELNGCAFAPRCPYELSTCSEIRPELRSRNGELVSEHLAACHLDELSVAKARYPGVTGPGQ